MEQKDNLRLPLLITRMNFYYPNIIATIEAARPFSIKAIKTSIEKCDNLILVVSQKSLDIDEINDDSLFEYGTIAKIISNSEENGYFEIKIKPISRVKFLGFSYEDDCYVAEAQMLEEKHRKGDEETELVEKILSVFKRSDSVATRLPKSLINSIGKVNSTAEIADSLAFYLPLPPSHKQKLIELTNVYDRLKFLLDYLSDEKELADLDRRLDLEVRRAAEKSQKEYFLREKMKAIRSELGEDDEDESSIANMLKRVEDNPYPDYVKAKVKSEAKRYENMPQSSLEAATILNYIDWLVNTPWYQTTKDSEDLDEVQKILDEDHYGLDLVKKRIVEYLAVKKKTNSLKAPIICFYGPPGVGKTSLGKSIARSLGRKFFKASLGGISDEAEIRGHRRTYVGSMPGRIIAGMKKCGVTNPVFLLDEVDKLGSSYKGDPASALLEVLDPEQNFAFNDNYLEEPYDLSNVLFIATANQIENIPGPLRDRMEMIEVTSYTEIEKLHIACEHLIPKQLLINGLENNNVSFETDAVLYIIRRYTRESGVRELERRIGSCLRKVVVESLKDNDESKSYIVTKDKVIEYLGLEKFDDSEKEKEDQVGVVTGLAYTQYGGDILPIEVTHFEGKGALVLTGSLGNVMKESSSIALDYVRSNAKKYGIDPQVFLNNDIHIHFPEGAVPKDGPSAGVAITLAIISSLSGRKVKSSVAMTGEVTLRGKALPIGGLREKSLAASRSGISTIIIPRENEKNLMDIPNEVKNSLEIIFMDCVDDAIAVAMI